MKYFNTGLTNVSRLVKQDMMVDYVTTPSICVPLCSSIKSAQHIWLTDGVNHSLR